MALRCREEVIDAPSLPAPEVVKVRVVLIHGATGRCEQVSEDAEYAPLLIDRKYRNELLAALGRKAAVKMTETKDRLPE